MTRIGRIYTYNYIHVHPTSGSNKSGDISLFPGDKVDRWQHSFAMFFHLVEILLCKSLYTCQAMCFLQFYQVSQHQHVLLEKFHRNGDIAFYAFYRDLIETQCIELIAYFFNIMLVKNACAFQYFIE